MMTTVTTKPEIDAAHRRSALFGLSAHSRPILRARPIDDGVLCRAARPVLERLVDDYAGIPLTVCLAGPDSELLDVRFTDARIGEALNEAQLVPGVRLGEDTVGTNAIGTVVELRRPLLVEGGDHFLEAFSGFTCFGHPVIHPHTGRLVGVLNVGGAAGVDHRFFGPMARRAVADVQQRLVAGADAAQRRLYAAFRAAPRRAGTHVIALSDDVVMGDPGSLDVGDPSASAALRAIADEMARGSVGAIERRRLELASGAVIEFSCRRVEGVEGVLLELDTPSASARSESCAAQGWPLLLTGEPGSGRSREALAAAGPDRIMIEVADAARVGERALLERLVHLLHSDGPAVVIDDVHLFGERTLARLAPLIARSPRKVVLTAIADSDGDLPAGLVAACGERRTLLPLRRRRHEIPALATAMLRSVAHGDVRFTPAALRVLAAQPWPGNVAELGRVVRAVAATRSAGDIVVTDLPASHRGSRALLPPIQDAEREVIVAAITAAGGNKARAARALGLSRSTLYNRIRALKIA